MSESSHFDGKSPLEHVAAKVAQGKLSTFEVHGTEPPGHFSAGADAARETGMILILLGSVLSPLHLPNSQVTLILLLFASAWVLWKCGRSAWLGWSRLERLHRIVKQEKWEIEHNRDQEKKELTELYAAKGFEGKLLENVVNTLMADGDRLLRVMVEEELGLKLESHEHPLKQACGAGLGTLFATCFILLGHVFFPYPAGLIIGAFITIALASAVSAYSEGNRLTPAILWNLGIAGVAFAWFYFLYIFFSEAS